jgi:hypothetical protein
MSALLLYEHCVMMLCRSQQTLCHSLRSLVLVAASSIHHDIVGRPSGEGRLSTGAERYLSHIGCSCLRAYLGP